MIQGDNPNNILNDEEPEFVSAVRDSSSVSSVMDTLKRRRDNVINGGVNCIPLPFERFRSELPGIEQEQYVVVTANEKVGKTSFADFLYVFHVLDYCYSNPGKCSCHIIYFSLEETVEKVITRYMSHLLYKLDGIRIAPTDLRSTNSDYPVPQEVLDKLESDEYRKRLEYFDNNVQFETEDTNPTGILRVCKDYAKTVGEYKSHKQMSNGASFKEVEVFDSYRPYDPNHYKIVILDHIGLITRRAA